MNKKIIITIVLIIIIIVTILAINKKNQYSQPDITEIPSRNDTAVIPESTSTSTIDTVYSIAEVNMHDKPTDCWLVIGDKVINPTDFIAKELHPNDKIVDGCGKDATEMFASVNKHDGGKAQAALKQYQIGVLE